VKITAGAEADFFLPCAFSNHSRNPKWRRNMAETIGGLMMLIALIIAVVIALNG
jgi:hypothetical protein